MALSPRMIGPAISLMTGLITSFSLSFIGLAMNYGFQPDFLARWLKSAATGYAILISLLLIVGPPIQRLVLRWTGVAG